MIFYLAIAYKIIQIILFLSCYEDYTFSSHHMNDMSKKKKKYFIFLVSLNALWCQRWRFLKTWNFKQTSSLNSLLYFLSVHLVIKPTVHRFLILLAQQIYHKEHSELVSIPSCLSLQNHFQSVKPYAKPQKTTELHIGNEGLTLAGRILGFLVILHEQKKPRLTPRFHLKFAGLAHRRRRFLTC